MHWTPEEQEEAARLLAAAQDRPLSPRDQRRLRVLVVKEKPAVADFPDDRIVRAGMIAYGARLFVQAFTRDSPPTTA